jgi:hypothetical protein
LLPNGKVLVAGGYNGAFTGVELYDPASGTWSATSGLATARDIHTATLLLNGNVLVAAGNSSSGYLTSAELYDISLGFIRPDWQPQISTATAPLVLGSSLTLTGSRFQGISQACGGNLQDSSTNYPLVQLRNIENSQVAFLPVDPIAGWSDGSFASLPVNDFPPGPALVTVFTNGIPSGSKYVLVTSPAPSPTPTATPTATATATATATPTATFTPTPEPTSTPTATATATATSTPTATATATATSTATATATATPTATATATSTATPTSTPTSTATPTATPAYAAQVQQPINADGSSVFNVRRGVVPAKFTLTVDGVATCDLPPATIAVYRTSTGGNQQVDEAIYSGSADTGSNFRIDNCQYVYNLSANALGVGTYRVDIIINGQVVGSATFQLR